MVGVTVYRAWRQNLSETLRRGKGAPPRALYQNRQNPSDEICLGKNVSKTIQKVTKVHPKSSKVDPKAPKWLPNPTNTVFLYLFEAQRIFFKSLKLEQKIGTPNVSKV